jgi:four helix bundle protein
MVRSYKDLTVWQKSMDLVEEIYRIAKLLPSEERYALSDQMRRAAVSIPSNIAEGNARGSKKDYANFLTIAKGSCAELETQCQICVRLNYIKAENIQNALSLCDEVGRMLTTMIVRFRNNEEKMVKEKV